MKWVYAALTGAIGITLYPEITLFLAPLVGAIYVQGCSLPPASRGRGQRAHRRRGRLPVPDRPVCLDGA